jgi:hypothetical protein
VIHRTAFGRGLCCVALGERNLGAGDIGGVVLRALAGRGAEVLDVRPRFSPDGRWISFVAKVRTKRWQAFAAPVSQEGCSAHQIGCRSLPFQIRSSSRSG